MFEQRSLKLDICALGLLALSSFLIVALWTYDKTDPPSTVVYPASDVYQNACGRTGAYAAHYLLESFGLGTFYIVGSLVILTALLLTRREIDQPILRAVGWAISLLAVTTIAALVIPNLTLGPVIGAGGYMGAMGRILLQQHFARAGSLIFAVAVFMAGVLLCTDYLVLKLAAFGTTISGRGLRRVSRLGSAATRPVSRRQTDVADGVELEVDEEDEWEDDEYEDDEQEEYEDGEYEDDDYEEDESSTAIKVRTPTRGEAASADAEPRQVVSSKNRKKPASPEDAGTAQPVDEPSESATAAPAASGSTNFADGLKSALGIKRTKPETPKPPAKKSEREEIIEQLEAADHQPQEDVDYELPALDLLLPADNVSYEAHEREVRRKAHILEKTFKNFGLNVRVVEIETGPVIAQFEVQLEAGLRLSKITGLADDLAIALRVPSVRIVAPIPGKNTVGIEVPNENREIVRLREVIEETNGRARRMKIPIYLGKDVAGNPMMVDLAALPHLLIAGRTGTGKSVCLNSIIVSMLMGRGPDEVRMLMIDPKMVELSGYRKLPHLMHPVVTDMRKAEAILAWAVDKMEERYQLLARAGVRHVSVYNQLGDEELRDRIRPKSETEWEEIPRQLPFIVIVADEMADLMLTAGKDVEQHIIRLAQKSRAVGIHLILATQKPTVDVITGLIKSNLPARIAFQVASRTDSRVVLDEMGAEKLLGNGDLLFLSPGTSVLLRGQGTYLSDDEITKVVDFVGTDDPQFADELMTLKTKEETEAASGGDFKNRDELYEAAVDIVVRERRGSVSLLQRALGIGYGRAARLIDFMAEDHIVGQYNGSQAREVLISLEDWEAMTGGQTTDQHTSSPATAITTVTGPDQPRRHNKVLPDPDDPSSLEEELEVEETDAESADDEEQWEYEEESEPDEDAVNTKLEENELEEDEEWEDDEETDEPYEDEELEEEELEEEKLEDDELEDDGLEEDEYEEEEYEDGEYEDGEYEEDDADDEYEEDEADGEWEDEEEEWEEADADDDLEENEDEWEEDGEDWEEECEVMEGR